MTFFSLRVFLPRRMRTKKDHGFNRGSSQCAHEMSYAVRICERYDGVRLSPICFGPYAFSRRSIQMEFPGSIKNTVAFVVGMLLAAEFFPAKMPGTVSRKGSVVETENRERNIQEK